jgi:hypothetical protein
MKQFGVFCLWLRTLVVSDLPLTCQWLMALYTCRQRSPTELSVAYGSGSALNRYKGSSIFAQIGVSKQYAGEELFNKIQNECIKQEPGNVIIIRPSLKILTYIFDQDLPLTCQWLMALYTCRQRSPTELSVAYGFVHLSSAISDWIVSGLWLCTLVSLYKCIWNHVCVYMSLINKFASRSIILWRKILFSDINSTEEDTEESKSENKFKFKSDIAVFHASITNKIKERRNLLRNIGPFRRALCARRDLEIRRQLCKIDKVKQEL